jgi:hypothetical protein
MKSAKWDKTHKSTVDSTMKQLLFNLNEDGVSMPGQFGKNYKNSPAYKQYLKDLKPAPNAWGPVVAASNALNTPAGKAAMAQAQVIEYLEARANMMAGRGGPNHIGRDITRPPRSTSSSGENDPLGWNAKPSHAAESGAKLLADAAAKSQTASSKAGTAADKSTTASNKQETAAGKLETAALRHQLAADKLTAAASHLDSAATTLANTKINAQVQLNASSVAAMANAGNAQIASKR